MAADNGTFIRFTFVALGAHRCWTSLGGGLKIHDLPHTCMRACGMLLIYVLFGLLFNAKLQSNKREVRRKFAVIENDAPFIQITAPIIISDLFLLRN